MVGLVFGVIGVAWAVVVMLSRRPQIGRRERFLCGCRERFLCSHLAQSMACPLCAQ